MTRPTFSEKWQALQHSRLAIGIAPQVTRLPAPVARYDDPFLPFGRAIIEATAEFACAFVFDLASYLALGAAGARALERTIPIVPDHLIKILHAPFFTADYVEAAFEAAFGVDAVTLANDDSMVVEAYAHNPVHGAFVLNGSPGSLNLPNVGSYNATGFTLLRSARVLWVTDQIIYASGTHEYEAAAREQAEIFQHKSLK